MVNLWYFSLISKLPVINYLSLQSIFSFTLFTNKGDWGMQEAHTSPISGNRPDLKPAQIPKIQQIKSNRQSSRTAHRNRGGFAVYLCPLYGFHSSLLRRSILQTKNIDLRLSCSYKGSKKFVF